jgi:four helix bundle protein
MTKITRFEDLIAWQKARALTREIYQVTRQEKLRKDFGLCGQMQRAAVSIMANIAEGFERNRKAEFHQFLSIAKGSCGELRSHLYVAWDAGYPEKDLFQDLLTRAEEVGKIVGGLRSSVSKLSPQN